MSPDQDDPEVPEDPSPADVADLGSGQVDPVAQAEAPQGDPDPCAGPVLPPPVRARVVAWAAQTLPELSGPEVPSGLRPFLRFRAERRGRLAAVPLAAAVDTDEQFRRQVAARVRTGAADLAAALDHGSAVPAADPVEVAAAVYLLRPAEWERRLAAAVAAVHGRLDEAEVASARTAREHVEHQLAEARVRASAEAERWRAEQGVAAEQVAELRRELRDRTGEARSARDRAAALEEELRLVREQAEAAASRARTDLRRLQSRLDDAEAAADALRRTAREGRSNADLRARLLLDTVLGAARGLERELALPPALGSPADEVTGSTPGIPQAPDHGGGLEPDDPVWLDRLLALPRAHLVVDGYNVTKAAYGSLTLADQRTRLVSGLAGLAARTAAEVTVVFDGAQRDPGMTSSWPRGVRVLFSDPGETADSLILRLVRAEPAGRPVVVVSSDREVADGARAGDARAVPSVSLARLLSR